MNINLAEIKIFVDWIKIKVHLHLFGLDYKDIHEREIWWASFGQNVGSELNGKNDKFERPVLIFKKVSDTTFWALPITSRTKKRAYSQFIFINRNGEENAIVWTQIRLMSSKRLIRNTGAKLSRGQYKELKRTFARFLGLKNETPPVGGESRIPNVVANNRGSVQPKYKPV